VTFDDWLLALHVLSAFAYVGGIVLFWVLIAAVRKVDTPEATIRMEPVVKVGNAVVGIGAGGTLLLGIWLAFKLDSYAIWDGWIVAAA
jgi:tetraacyldisaccharide-1-P 4'-kinase